MTPAERKRLESYAARAKKAEAERNELRKNSDYENRLTNRYIRLLHAAEAERDASRAEVERLRAELELANGSLDALRNFLGDMAIKLPVGRVIQEVKDLRAYHGRTEAALVELSRCARTPGALIDLDGLGLARGAKETM